MSEIVPAAIGIGTTRFGKLPEHDINSLGIWALHEAIADCGIGKSTIDGLILHRITDYERFIRVAGLQPSFISAVPPQGRMSGTALQTAASLIQSGAARCIALVYGNDGRSARTRRSGSHDRDTSADEQLWSPYGMTANSVPALQFQRHRALYGTKTDHLGEISVAFRGHACLNPDAVMRSPITIEDYRAARLICEPLRLLDYCVISDGAVAMILASSDLAQDLKQTPVLLRGYAVASRLHEGEFSEDFGRPVMKAVADRTFAMAGVTHSDIDSLMIYDNFTPNVLFSLEGYGFCDVGESGPWLEDGCLRLGGRYPSNTNGGHLSDSYMHGWSLNVEAVRQLRGQCGTRQVKGAQHVQYISGGPICSSIIYGLGRS